MTMLGSCEVSPVKIVSEALLTWHTVTVVVQCIAVYTSISPQLLLTGIPLFPISVNDMRKYVSHNGRTIANSSSA